MDEETDTEPEFPVIDVDVHISWNYDYRYSRILGRISTPNGEAIERGVDVEDLVDEIGTRLNCLGYDGEACDLYWLEEICDQAQID